VTPISDMIERMAAAGASIELIMIAARAMEEVSHAQATNRRAKDAERQKRKRGRDLFEPQDIVVDVVDEDENESRDKRDSAPPEPPQKEVPTPLRKTTSELPKGSSSDASASQPIYTDSKHELWGEGVPILIQLGVKETQFSDSKTTVESNLFEDCNGELENISVKSGGAPPSRP